MNFAFNQTVLLRALESSGVALGLSPELWIKEFILDDFSLKPTNRELIKLILENLPSSIRTLADNIRSWRPTDFTDVSHLRMYVFAYVMVNDTVKFIEYHRAWHADPDMYKRFSSIAFDEHHISLHFDEIDE